MVKWPEKEYKVYSFDIYDTLLFRTELSARGIYYKTFEKNRELFPEYMDAEEWANLRVAAENKARAKNCKKYGSTEIFMHDIYEMMPRFIEEPRRILDAEYRTEKESCFINPDVYEMLKQIKGKGHRVVLISDMYLTACQLKEILQQCGMDMSYVDHLYVSCEVGVSKKYKKLFDYVLENEHIQASEMLHIGDNEYSDVSVPSKMGIDTICYDVVSRAEYKFPFLKLERQNLDCKAQEIYALRNLLADIYSDRCLGDDRFWYLYGLMILGPLCTGATEWVLDEAKKHGISKIFPLMREGKFLCNLLKNSMEYRKENFDVRPLYVSRKAVFLPSLSNPTEKDISYVFNSHGILVKDVFEIFEMPELATKYKKYAHEEIVNTKKIRYANTTLWSELWNLFTSNEVMKQISNNSKEARKNLVDYLDSFGVEEPYITWDMGWRGYTQTSIDRILREENKYSTSLNLLIVGRGGSVENILEGCDIKGYVGSFGKNWTITNKLFSKIFELFFICEEGTTIGYKKIDGVTVPVTREISYSDEKQKRFIGLLQDGAQDFQRVFLELSQRNANIYNMVKKPEELCRIVARSLSMPTEEEVIHFANLFYDQNFGADTQKAILAQEKITKLSKYGVSSCLQDECISGEDWIAGAMVIEDPFLNFKKYYLKRGYIPQYRRVCFAQKIIQKYSGKKVVFVGAGAAMVEILHNLRIVNCDIEIEAIVDNNPKKWGDILCGVLVKSFEEEFESKIYIVSSFDYAKELADSVYQKKGTNIEVVTLSDECFASMI